MGLKKESGKYVFKKNFVERYKNRPCVDCGLIFPSEAMQYDHLPQADKKFSLHNSKERGLQNIMDEIDKCVVRCANCHAIMTKTRLNIEKMND